MAENWFTNMVLAALPKNEAYNVFIWELNTDPTRLQYNKTNKDTRTISMKAIQEHGTARSDA